VALRAQYTLINSEFNAFLFAPIGEEGNGMMLSVISALARLEIDPWEEAARLAALPKEIATTALNRLIDRLPRGLWVRSDVPEIAARLIELLPGGALAVEPGRVINPSRLKVNRSTIGWLLILALSTSLLFGMLGNRTSRPDNGAAASSAPSTTSPAVER